MKSRIEDMAELRSWVDYDPLTGNFTWSKERANIRAGNPAGCVDKSRGYTVIGFKGRLYYAHRLALFFTTGLLPEMVDHINGERADNRICNLRPATASINQRNRKPSVHRASEFKGVGRSRQKWRAFIGDRHLGVFATPEAAARAYDEAALAAYGDCARLNFGEAAYE